MSASDNELVDAECGLCHGNYLFTRRRLREFRQRGKPPLCSVCRILATLEIDATLGERSLAFWLERFSDAALDDLLAGIFGPRALTSSARARRRELRERLAPGAAVAA